MKYLVSIPKEIVNDDKWTTAREPVVPCFPSQSPGAFLAIGSFKLADKAEVAETDADPDEMATALYKEFPGLPRRLHENYIFEVFKAVSEVKEGTVFKVLVNQRQAILVDDVTGTTTILWNEQPMT